MISVVVPVYNVEDYLEQCIESIAGQTYTEIEIILVDDGSTDRSSNICDAYAHIDRRIHVMHKKNGGSTSARKAGIRCCRGEYVSFVDADDWIEPDMFRIMLDQGAGSNIMVFAAYEESAVCQKIKGSSVAEGLYEGSSLMKLYGSMMMNGDFYVHGIPTNLWGKLFRREIIEKIQLGIPDQITYGEDAACVYPCLLNAQSVYVSNIPLYHYRIRQGSIVHGGCIGIDNFRYLYAGLKKSFRLHGQHVLLEQQLNYFIWQALLLKEYDIIPSPVPLFPFPKVEAGMKIAIYGAGLFGQTVRQYCLNSGIVSVCGWFDRDYQGYIQQGLPVDDPAAALDTDFDIMVIAILNMAVVRQIQESYTQSGISDLKIDSVSLAVLDHTALPFHDKDQEESTCI